MQHLFRMPRTARCRVDCRVDCRVVLGGAWILVLSLAGSSAGQSQTRIDWRNAFDEPAADAASEPAFGSDIGLVVVDRQSHIDIPDTERPAPRRDSAVDAPRPALSGPTESELQELSQWVRWMALKNLPPNIEDNRKWGKQRKVYDGFDAKWEGLRLDTKRRWKMVNHGTWSRYFIEFIDPAQRLEIQVLSLDTAIHGCSFKSRVRITAPMKMFARVSQFQRDVQIISVSMQAEATVALEADLEVGIKINPLVFPPEVEFQPKAMRAEAQVLEFEVHRISQIRGDIAEWLGEGIRKILDRKLSQYNEKLVDKINQGLAKQQDRLKLSPQEWLSSTFNKRAATGKGQDNPGTTEPSGRD